MVSIEAENAVPASRGGLYPWLVVALLMLLYTSSFVDRSILNLLVKPIRADLGLSDTEYSLLTGLAFVLMYSTAGIPLGWALDRGSRRVIVAMGVTTWSIMTAACGLANSFWGLFAARVGVGVGEATLSPGAYSLISDYFPAERLSRALSVYGLGSPVGTGLALIIGGTVIKAISAIGPIDLPLVGVTQPWQAVFFAVGLPGLLLAALTLLLVREPPRKEKTGAIAPESQPPFRRVIGYLWQYRAVYGPFIAALSLLNVFSIGSNAWYPAYLQRVHGFTIAQSGLFVGTSNVIFGLAGCIAAGWWADRLVSRGKADGNYIVMMFYAAGSLLCGTIGPILPVGWLSLGLISVTSFFSITLTGVSAAALMKVTPNRMQGQVAAIYLFTTGALGLSIGPTGVAAVSDFVFRREDAIGEALAIVGAVSLVLGFLALQFGRKPYIRKIQAQQHDAAVGG